MAETDPILQKTKLVNFTVLTGVVLVAWQMLHPIPMAFQLTFLVIGLLLTGIPHGALDHLVQQETAKRRGKPFKLFVFLGGYLLNMLLYALAWYVFPSFSLFFFLLISCWHFGETDIETYPQQVFLTVILRFLYGVFVLSWILLAHKTEVGPVLLHLVPARSLLFEQWLWLSSHAFWLLPLSGLILLVLLLFTGFYHNYPHWSKLTLQLLAILLCTYFLPLLPAFGLYFAGWHGLVTLFNIKGFIIGENAAADKTLFKIWKRALPFSLLAITGLLLAGYLLPRYAPLFDPLPLLFVFLSLITLPHMQVMHGLNS
ncbi:Brp/Blh family beta-carotene 15,15'-dioxygenase [Mucilaginibacter sp.]|uniref:Brp/Blh family beta-carotene 15,15'-dioxygenase n=1 Tax=Mucilaginibacter sp. TaxID=1882438 RepID=UPI003B00934E